MKKAFYMDKKGRIQAQINKALGQTLSVLAPNKMK